MTQVAKMILNELPISPTINGKIEFIKSSKLNFKDFNNFRLLLNSLEGFEPSSKLSPKEYKAQINRRIGVFLERLNILEKKIKSTQIPQIEQESKPNEVLNKDENKEDSLNDRAKYFYLLAEIETFANKTEQDSQTLGKLLERTSDLLLNAENLNEDAINTLEETKESLQEYFIHLRENERKALEALSSNDIASRKQEIYNLLSNNVTNSYPYNEMQEYDKHCIIFDKSMDIKLALQFRKELEKLNFKVKFLEDDTTSIPDDKRYIVIFGDNESSVFNAYDTLLNSGYYSATDNNVDEIFKTNENSQDSNPQPTIKTSLFDDEEVKPPKKRMS